jgi:hypothetical protein
LQAISIICSRQSILYFLRNKDILVYVLHAYTGQTVTYLSKRLKVTFHVLVLTVLLGGCAALPVPVQVASWALDGLSVITTQKSVSDHGISLVANQDCAVWRGLTENQLCRPYLNDAIESEILTAAAPMTRRPSTSDLSFLSPSFKIDETVTQPVLSNLYLDII